MNLKEKAIFYWQDKLAKFWPTLKGPPTPEIVMYEAGYKQALADAAAAVEKVQNRPPDNVVHVYYVLMLAVQAIQALGGSDE